MAPVAIDLDLALTLGVSGNAINDDDPLVCTIAVVNNGPDNCDSASVYFPIPAGISWDSDDGAGAYNSATGYWALGAVANGVTKTLVVTLNPDFGTGGVFNMTASISSPSDSNGANNTDTEVVTITSTRVFDLVVDASANNLTPGEGATVNMILTLTNNGNVNAPSVNLSALLPSGLTYQSHSGDGTYVSGTGVWTLGAVNATLVKTLTVVALVENTGSYVWTATLTSPVASDDNATNDTDTVTLVPVPPPATDIEVLLSADDTTPNVGTNIVFTVAVHNYGPTISSALLIDALLPAGFTYVSDNAGGDYNSGTGVWDIGALANGATESLQITALTLASGSYAFTASLNSVTPGDTNAANDTDTLTPVPVPVADLAVDISTPSLTPASGSNIVLTLTVTNNGPSSASSVVATALLPSGLTYVSDTGSGAYNSGTGVWTVGTVANGATPSITVTATVAASGSYVCPISLTSSTPTDVTNGNDTDTLTLVPTTGPGGVSSGLIMWLKSDVGVTQSGGLVSAWADQSSAGNNLVQATGGSQPSYNASNSAYNNLPSIDCTAGKWLGMAALSYGAFTFICVARTSSNNAYFYSHGGNDFANFDDIYTSGNTSCYITRGGTTSAKNLGTGWGISANPRTYAHAFDGNHTGNILKINGTTQTMTNGTANNPGTGAVSKPWQINGYDSGTDAQVMTFGEVILFDRALTSQEILDIEAYLKTRYAHY